METLKQVLAFPVYATVAWLVWVLAQQVGPRGLLAALIGLVLVGFAAWAWERGRAAAARDRPRRAGRRGAGPRRRRGPRRDRRPQDRADAVRAGRA